MNYKHLVGTGIVTSSVCLGAMTFGGQLSIDESIAIVHAAKDEGINFIDTANSYTRGESEKIVGRAIEKDRNDWVVATKVCNSIGNGPNDGGLSRKHIINAVESSLRNLRTDYIDLYYLHRPDHHTPISETMEAMHQLLLDGKIRYIGISNYSAWSIVDILSLCRERLLTCPVVNQTVYNMLTRGIEDELLPMTAEHHIGTIAYNPLASGLLTGKHKRDAPVSGTRLADSALYKGRYWTERNLDAVDAFRTIASKHGMSLLEMAMRFCSGADGIDCILVGVSHIDQLKQNVEMLLKDPLSKDVIAEIDQVYQMLPVGERFKYYR